MAQTSNTDPYNYTMTFDLNRVQNATDIAIARTMMHESIHAYLFSVFALNDSIYEADFPLAWAKFLEDPNKDFSTDEGLHHEQMAQSYVDALKFGLIDIYGVSDYKNEEYWENIALGGLIETAWFDTTSVYSSTRKRTIKDQNSYEDTNHEYSRGSLCN